MTATATTSQTMMPRSINKTSIAAVLLLLLAATTTTTTNAGFISKEKQHHLQSAATATTTADKATASTSTTKLNSIPNAFDVFTSGLTSMCRLPNGVNAMSTSEHSSQSAPTLTQLPKFKRLYDIENSRACRQIRELITRYDICIEEVVPATTASANLPGGYAIPALVVEQIVAETNKPERLILNGVQEITVYLERIFGPSKQKKIIRDDDVVAQVMDKAQDAVDVLGSFVAGVFRSGRGEVLSPAALSNELDSTRKPLILYSYEGNQFCRLVREVLTELNIVYELRSVGKWSPRRSELAVRRSDGSTQCPYIIDPNTGVEMGESKDIITYLYKNYAKYTPPDQMLEWASANILEYMKPLFEMLSPIQAGSNQENPEIYQSEIIRATREIKNTVKEHPVVIYTYKLSPFCAEAKKILEEQLEKMDDINVSIKEVSLGSEWLPGFMAKGGAQTRQALLDMTGQSSLPHVFVNGKSLGGLFSGLLPAIQDGTFHELLKESTQNTKYDDLMTDTLKTQELISSIKEKAAAQTASLQLNFFDD
mmetsp:Transcript_22838/g.64649  ORF Transcript_22838/g.64649 Transcript_22838/m.64649 type:complete len:539 (+) Transcript_22838:144-1760(+)